MLDKFQDLSTLTGWKVLTLGPAAIEMILQGSLLLRLNLRSLAQAEPNAVNLQLVRQEKPRKDSGLCEGFVAILMKSLAKMSKSSPRAVSPASLGARAYGVQPNTFQIWSS